MADAPLAISPFLGGDPLRLGPEITSPGDVLSRLDLPPVEGLGCLLIAPGLTLIYSLTGHAVSMTLRWVNLPHRPRLTADLPPVEAAVVLIAPIVDSARALRLVGRLMACLAEPGIADRARAATTREALVEALAPVERSAGEVSLGASELLSLLGSSPSGLSAVEATRRRLACGPNRLERVGRRPLLMHLFEQFWSFFAVLLWVAGVFAVMAGMTELGWAIFAVIVVNGLFSFLQEYRAEKAMAASRPGSVGTTRISRA